MIDYTIAVRSAHPGTKSENVSVTKAYGVAQQSEIMALSDFARHISEHGCVYSRADVEAILILMVDCLREMLLQGRRVQMGDLGSFGVSLKTMGATNPSEFSADNIKAVNVAWSRGSAFRNLRDEATFRFVPTRNEMKEACQKVKNQTTIGGEDTIDPDDGGNPDDGQVVD